MSDESSYLIAVHAGAGYHASKNDAKYCDCMKRALKAAAQTLEITKSSLKAVEAAIVVLEDSPITNAGRGSNLNMEGYVECDASIMDADGTFGSIAAAPGIPNPIKAATLLAEESRQPLAHGLVRPLMLSGDGAWKWAAGKGLATAKTLEEAKTYNISYHAQQQWMKYKAILDASDDDDQHKDKKQKIKDEDDDHRNDTVGCVVVDSNGHVAAGVSSGGIVLKMPGRVGEAAVYGAGCFANTNAACSVTGVGERVMQHLMAMKCAERVQQACSSTPTELAADACATYIKETILNDPPPTDCGVLSVSAIRDDECITVGLGVAHCASSMAVGYMTPDESLVKILRRRKDDQVCTMSIGTYWDIPV